MKKKCFSILGAALTTGFLMVVAVNIASATTIDVNDPSAWTAYLDKTLWESPGGQVSTTIDGLKGTANGPRDGILMLNDNTFNFTEIGSTVHVKWMADGGGQFSYPSVRLLGEDTNNISDWAYIGVSAIFNTDHSYNGYTVIPEKVWFYTTFEVTGSQQITISTYQDNYGFSEGTLFESKLYSLNDDQWEALGRVQFGLGIHDNYAGTNAWVIVGDVNINTATVIPATIDIYPDTVNLKNKGRWMTCYIEPSEGYDVNHIDVATVSLNINGIPISAELSPTEVGDYDNDGIWDLMVKFDRLVVQNAVTSGAIEMTVSGSLTNPGENFEGTDTVLVIDKGKEHTNEEDHGAVEY